MSRHPSSPLLFLSRRKGHEAAPHGGPVGRDWVRKRKADRYYRAAKREGFRSRAAFKLLQIDQRFELLYEGDTVVDLGAAPGGWSQVARGLVGDSGRVVAVDLVRPSPLEGVEFVRGDVSDPALPDALAQVVSDVHTVLSDVAPHLSGNRTADHARSAALVRDAFRVAQRLLRPGGCFVAKVFQGEELPALKKELQTVFTEVRVHAPRASLQESRETYLVAKGFRPTR